MYARSMAWHSPLAHEANTMKAALVSPEVAMNIHMHMYTPNTQRCLFTIKVSLDLELTSFSFDSRCECEST